MKRRVFSFVTALALCLNLCPAWALAAEDTADATLCPHHPAHTDACGYTAPAEGQPCTHEHTEGCYTEQTQCIHVHDASCYGDVVLPAEDEDKEADACTHDCTEDSGCVTRTLDCRHEHDDTCGYVPETPGADCTFSCRVCPLEELLAALPDSVTADNGEQVGEQLDEIFELYNTLTEEEQEQVDLSPCAALMDQLEELSTGELSDSSGSQYILTADEQTDITCVVANPLLCDTSSFTLTYTGRDSAAILVTETGDLELRGKVVSQNGVGVKVESGGSLTVVENTSISGSTYALYVAKDAKNVQLSAGTYSSTLGYSPIYVEGGNYAALLAPGFAFSDANGNVLPPSDLAGAGTLTVGQCSDHSRKTYTPTPDAPTHTWTCAYCGTKKTEPCTFVFEQDGNGTCEQEGCGNKLTIKVDENALPELVYDGTLKPEEITTTVTLSNGSNKELTRDVDYQVSFEPRKDAGKVTVTVTGITFNGTFEKTYTVEKAEPKIEWSNTTFSVDYDGKEVDDLPGVTITAVAGDDLSSNVRYAYKIDGDANFTEGLPKDAGDYQVKAYLVESDNYTGMETKQLLTLTINPIAPIVTSPAAARPTYNRAPQALVTEGKLNPVAKADGLEIKFATAENGPFSTTIPTGTNAGTYNVWYKLEVSSNYIAPDPNPARVDNVEILRKPVTPVVTLSQYTYLYDGGYKQPTVTVKDDDRATDLPDTEYKVEYVNNRNVSTDKNPAKVVVTDKIEDGGNYDITQVEVEFKITSKIQNTLSITNKPATFTYGDKFTLGTSGGSGDGLVTWEIVPVAPDVNVATVDKTSGQVTITGHGPVTVKATKSGKDPATGVVNYEDATAVWTFTAVQKPVTATVTAEDKTYNGNNIATVHAEVKDGVLPGDVITITGLTGTFDNENAGEDKTVTVDTTGSTITGNNSEHYAVTYSGTTVKATITKATAKITNAPDPATLTYDGTAQALIGTAAVVDPSSVQVEYSLSQAGPYSTDFPKGTDAGTYTVWYRVQETDNYTGLDPENVTVTIDQKPVAPVIKLSGNGLQTDYTATPPTYSYVYDGKAKEPVVTLYEADGTTAIPAGEYTVAYSGNVNVGTATVTVTAKADGNYSFENTPVTATFTISKKQAKVLTAPEPTGRPLTFTNYAQRLVTAGEAEGGTMVYRVGDTGNFNPGIPEETNAGTYKVYYKVEGDSNHSNSDEGSVEVIIAPKVVTQLSIELQNDDGSAFVSCTYDGSAKTPKVVVKDGSTVINGGDDDGEYNVVYSNNKDAGTATVSIADKPGGNYTVMGSTTFVINKADIVFNPAPSAANLTYDGTAQELLIPGTTTGGTVYYALGSDTAEYHDYIPTGVNAGSYKVYYKVTGDKNHNDFAPTLVSVTIQRKPLTTPTIELTPDSFKYDGAVHLPTVTVKDGDTVLPASEYTWKCYDASGTNEVSDPKDGGTYTITVSGKDGGNYDLSSANPNTATFTIGKAQQAELVIAGKPEPIYYGDTFKLTMSGGSGSGGLSWATVGGNADIDTDGNVTVKGVGEVTINVVKDGDTNYAQTSTQWTFTAKPKPVTAEVTVSDKTYDGNTTATVSTADINTGLVTGDTVTIDRTSITAAFDDPHAGADKTVTLDTSKVQVTGDAPKYAISYPETVTANITQATTTITTAPADIASLTYNGQPQALVTEGKTNVGFLVYSLDGTDFSREIPTGTDAGTYTVYYKVDETDNYTGIAANTTPISVAIDPKTITPKIELSETSFLYDGTKKNPKVTVKDGDTVLDPDQYTATWDNDLTSAGTHTVTISEVSGKNYTFTKATASVEITPADQDALNITGKPEHVYYGDTITTLGTQGGTGNGSVTWKVTSSGNNADIDQVTGKLTITGTGSVTVRAERSVPNYGTVGDNWNFTVEPKPVTAEVTVAAKTYDGTTTIADTAITAQVKRSDLVGGDTVTLSGLKGVYSDPNAGTGKTVTLNATSATADNTDKYAVSYPATAKGDITAKNVTVTVTLSDHDLKTDTSVTPNVYYYEYDGTEKKPAVEVTGTDGATLAASDFSVAYANNKNVGTATVTVKAEAGGNYTFADETVQFEIRSASAVLTSSPQARDLTYNGTEQELVTVGTATGGTVVYALKTGEAAPEDTDYSGDIPKGKDAGTYTVYYKVKGDTNHGTTAPQQVTATIKPKEITPAITLEQYSYVYDGKEKKPTVTVEDGTDVIPGPGDADKPPEYSVSYRDNINAGTATVTVSDNNGGNYIVNGTASFTITKADPTVTAPTAITGLQYNGELQELVNAGGSSDGTVVYAVNGGNYSAAIPTASAVGTYTITWKVQGDANHSDTDPATLSVKIAKNTVTDPAITLSQNQFTYDGSQHRPTVTVYDNNSRLIPTHEYRVTITAGKPTNTSNMVDVDTYTVTIAAAANSNYEFQGTLTRTFEIVPADQETISITGTRAQVRYGDTIQLGATGGTGSGTVTWKIEGATGTTLTQNGLLTVKDVNTSITVTVTRSRGGNYTDVSDTWEFTAGKKPVTAEVTVAAKNWDGDTDVDKTAITATVKTADLAFTGDSFTGDSITGDSITITGLTGTYDNANVGTGKTVTLDKTNVKITGTNADKYDVTIPATATASILGVAATVDTQPAANTPLTYDAGKAQALVTAGSATGGIMVYSLDGKEFTPNIPKGKDAGTYTVYYKAQGDQNHTDSEPDTVDVTIGQQTVEEKDLQIELSPLSGQYDGKVQQPAVTVRDGANNVIPESEYKVTYVTDNGANWKDKGTYTVKVENITGGNYKIETAMETFTISTSAQAPLEIVNKPGLVYYGDTFTLSATGGSGNEKVTWSVDPAGIIEIDANGFVKVVGVGSATITATKAGGGNYEDATATYPLNALQKPVTAIVTADDKVYDGNANATIHVTWEKGALVGNDTINTTSLSGSFADAQVGTGKTVTITGDPVSDTTAQKYDITIPGTTTASITKAPATAPSVTAVENLEYNGSPQALVSGGGDNTLYSTAKDGVYTATVPTRTNAGTYTVWYKAKGDANHTDSEPQAIKVTISPKTLTLTDADVTVELSGNDLKTDTTVSPNVYYYEYDGTEKKPSVVIKDGSAVIASSEYTVTYSNNKNVTTSDKKATVTITDNADGNYTFTAATVNFEIHAGSAQLTSSPKANDLTYNGAPQQLVTVGTATGGHIEYRLTSAPADETTSTDFSPDIPTGTKAGTYTVDYQVMGDDNHKDGPSGSVMVTIQPKTVVSPTITVIGGPFTYTGSAHVPTVTVVDGGVTIPDTEYTLSYQDNVNAGTATVIVSDNNGGDYTVNVTATFEIAKVAATVGTPPTGKTGLHYNGTAQELLDEKGTATGGTLVYSLSETGEYSAAIPTGKAVDDYTIWYKVQGDANHSDSAATALSPKVEIAKNTVNTPTIQVTPASVKYTGEKQEPTITVRDDNGLLIDGSEYNVTYKDAANSDTDPTAVGTYTVTVTAVPSGNYTFDIASGVTPVTFTITPADQTALTITGTRERVYYGDTIQLGATGGVSGGTVTWKVSDGAPASIGGNTGLLEITGTGSVTVTATSTKTGYADQTATWQLYAEKKPVTALVTATSKTYDGDADADVTATLQPSDFVGTDRFTITLTVCTFEDPNAGTDKKVNVVSTNPTFTVDVGGTNCYENYAITYPATATASIFKADIEATDVTAPTAATGLEYTGLPRELVTTAGSAPGGIMEYSTDGKTYSTSLPTGTDAGDYDVWYRVKGDGNHNDTTAEKLTDTTQVTITPQTVKNPTIELTPSGASYDGQEHKPAVKVLDANGRVIPDSEYTVNYGTTNWRDVGSGHTVTIVDKDGGNYNLTGTLTKTFEILSAGQSPLSIVGQPGTVQYGDVFTLSTIGGSGTGALKWEIIDENGVAELNSQNGQVKIKKAGGPVTITARKAAGGGYAETTATWTFSAEMRPATAIVTARNKPYDGNTTATLDITWKAGDLLGSDSISLNLTGTFDDANVGPDKIVRITRNGDLPDGGGKYAVTYNDTTTASITATPATVSGVQSGPWIYSGSEIDLLQGGSATNGTIVYSRNGVDFMENSPTETNAGKYTVYYKARGNTNYADSDVRMVEVTIQPKQVTVTNPDIVLSSDSFEYDGTAKEPDVLTVKDGSNVIPASEYTVSYRNNTAVGTATVTITDVPGGNYNVSGKTTFTITAGAPALTAAPQPKDLTYTGKAQALVTAGSAVNGKVMYSLDGGEYSATIPRATDAGDYEVAYKVVDGSGNDAIAEDYVYVTIDPKEVTPIIRLENRSSYSVAYDGSAKEPEVTVYVESKLYSGLCDYSYANNTNVGTAEVTVQSVGGNYQFLAFKTFEITKGKAEFSSPPTAKTNLVYNGTAQPLVEAGTAKNNSGIVLYSLDGSTYSTAVPTAIDRGSYTVYAKVQGSSNYEESDVVAVPVVIGVNTVQTPTVTLSSGSFSYTGSEVRPTVTVNDDGGNVIDSSEYTVTYTNNVNVGTAKVSIKSKPGGNYSFTASAEFQIVDASQTPLTITGKQDPVYYGDTLSLGATGGGSGAVAWSATGPVDKLGDGQYKVNSSGSVTITVTKGGSTDTWTFFAQPKPVTAVVTAANKVYDNLTTATLTVTLSGLVSGDNIATNTENGVTATGQFVDVTVGTNKTVIITELKVPSAVSEKYAITHNSMTTASITPAAASVTTAPELAGSLTYNGSAQDLLANSGTAASGNLMYSLDGRDYSYTIPTGTNAGTYTVWYKVEASDENHKDSAAVNLGTVTISANKDAPSILCTPATIQYDGTEQTPTVVVRDSAKRIIPESEYTVTFEASSRVDVGTYKVTVTDKPGGNYEFASPVTKEDAFEIVPASQNPLSIVTDIPTNVHYGDTFRLSAMGGSGSGAVQWSIVGNESGTPATINAYGVVTVTGTGGFTVTAYRVGLDGYNDSNTDSVPFEAKPKAVTPVVTASDKPYDGKTDAALTASWKSGDLVNGDSITLTVSGVFDTADAGTNKRVSIKEHTATGANAGKYDIIWPKSTTASIYKVDAKITGAPTGKTLNYTGSAQQLVSAGTTENNIGTVEYSMDQNGTYSTDIPTGTEPDTYRVWYKVADSVNYTGVAPAYVVAEIKAVSSSDTGDTDSENSDAGTGTDESSSGGTTTETTTNTDGTTTKTDQAGNKTETLANPDGSSVTTVEQADGTTATVNTDAEGKVAAEVALPQAVVTAAKEKAIVLPIPEVQAAASAGDAPVVTVHTGSTEPVKVLIPTTEAKPGTVAVIVKEDGTEEVVKSSVSTADGLAVTLTDGATVKLVDNSKTFTDIPAEGEAADAVAFASARELFTGTSEDTFSPDEPMTRAMMVTVLARFAGVDTTGGSTWYEKAAQWAKENGISSGSNLNSNITREQLAVMLWRYAGSPASTGGLDDFEDAGSVSGYAQEAMRWAVETGITGSRNGTLSPQGEATRAEVAQILKKFIESV